MYKQNANLPPTTFDKLFSYNKNIHHYYPTRVSYNFHLSNPHTSLASRSITHYGPDILLIPDSLKSPPSDQSSVQSSVYFFKNTMKTYIYFQNTYHNLILFSRIIAGFVRSCMTMCVSYLRLCSTFSYF